MNKRSPTGRQLEGQLLTDDQIHSIHNCMDHGNIECCVPRSVLSTVGTGGTTMTESTKTVKHHRPLQSFFFVCSHSSKTPNATTSHITRCVHGESVESDHRVAFLYTCQRPFSLKLHPLWLTRQNPFFLLIRVTKDRNFRDATNFFFDRWPFLAVTSTFASAREQSHSNFCWKGPLLGTLVLVVLGQWDVHSVRAPLVWPLVCGPVVNDFFVCQGCQPIN